MSRATAKEAVKEYFEKIGGRPERTLKRRKSGNVAAASAPSSSKKQKSLKSTATSSPEPSSDAKEADWFPKGTKSWDDEVIRVDTIVRDEKTNTLNAMVTWTNQKRGKVSLRLAYERLPQKVGSLNGYRFG
jgi:chromobox protein 1